MHWHFHHGHIEPAAKLYRLNVKSPPLEAEVFKHKCSSAACEELETWGGKFTASAHAAGLTCTHTIYFRGSLTALRVLYLSPT